MSPSVSSPSQSCKNQDPELIRAPPRASSYKAKLPIQIQLSPLYYTAHLHLRSRTSSWTWSGSCRMERTEWDGLHIGMLSSLCRPRRSSTALSLQVNPVGSDPSPTTSPTTCLHISPPLRLLPCEMGGG